MSWQTPTTSDLLASLSRSELDDIGSKGADIDQDATAQILARTAEAVRGYVRRTGVTMGPAGTIPSELLAACTDIAAVDIFLRLGVGPAEGRTDRRRDALQLLRDMADGKGVSPEGYGEADGGHPSPSFTDRTRTAGRDYEEGL
jgi:phage gp36-like protein